jgi:hypothetical protein
VENAIAKQPEANAELSRNWLSKEQLPPAIENTYFQIKDEQVQVRNVLIRRRRVVPPTPRRGKGYVQALSPRALDFRSHPVCSQLL